MMKMIHATLLSLLITGIGSVSAQGVAIQLSGTSKCLDVRDGNLNGGTAVQIYECSGSTSRWLINQGNTIIQLAGQNFCLDASFGRAGIGMTISECNISPQQQWYFTSDGNIQLRNTNLCLDVPGGSTQDGVQVQTDTCSNAQPNQVWKI